MADLDDEDDEAILFQAADQTIVADTVTPESGKILAQRFAE